MTSPCERCGYPDAEYIIGHYQHCPACDDPIPYIVVTNPDDEETPVLQFACKHVNEYESISNDGKNMMTWCWDCGTFLRMRPF